MAILNQNTNRFLILGITVLAILLIGFLDYITSKELSFSIFYIIPIAALAGYRGNKYDVLISSVLATFLWFYADYSSKEYSIIFFPIWNAFVRFCIFIAIGLLIVYVKEKEKKIKLANENLQEINEEKNRIIGIAAHDLRGPMSNIYSLSKLMISDQKDDLRSVKLIQTMSENAMGILDNLLDVSKIESGKIDLKIESIDFVAFVENQVQQSRILANNKNITITFHSELKSANLNFDKHYLSEVVDNLLSNAIKYSFSNSPIFVNISKVENKFILTEVIDKGQGIPESEQKSLFNYFQTTSTRPTDGEKSTGLGLAIVKKIIKLHNGEIGVKSILKEGSNFYFLLPIN